MHAFDDGPTPCMPTKAVLRSIRRQLKSAHALSRGDVRLAAAMGLVTAPAVRPRGFNDGLIYPVGPEPERAGARRSPTARLSLAPTPVRKMHALVLLVDFPDNVGARPRAEFEQLLFGADQLRSLTTYYRALSRNKLVVTGEVVGYVRAPRPYSFYTNGESGTGENSFPSNTPGLLVDALTVFCQTDSLARFDTDGDGFVDGIFLVHAGGGAEAEPDPTKRRDMIWSHKWVLPTPFENQGVKVFAYSTEPEDGRVGVFCHEFGHVLGLPDLYDTTYRSEGVGQWCLMGAGSWGGGGDRPTRMSCWCLAKLGWVKPAVVKRAGSLSLKTLEADPKACRRLWTKGKSGPEYFLIENRQTSGMDAELPGSGLAVWHIDETQSGNTNRLGYMVGLMQADGKRDLELNGNSGDDGDLFPGGTRATAFDDGTTPSSRTYLGDPTGVAISRIKEQGGTITARIKV